VSTVAVYSYTHSVTYVADNILKSLKDIILFSGLDPDKLAGDSAVLHRGISMWIESQHLESVSLEIFNPTTDSLIIRWDIRMSYSWDVSAGTFWTDTDQLRYAIKKHGLLPSQARYRVFATTKPGRPNVTGWSPCVARSTDGMIRQSLGGTIEHNGLSASASFWRQS
jgi:hypothetical protein